MQKMSSATFIKNCEVHCQEKISKYCYQHGIEICEKCLLEGHKKCRPVTNIENAFESLQNGVPLESLEKNFRDLGVILERMLSEKEKNIADLIEKKRVIRVTIQEARDKINAYLDKLMRSLELEIKTNHEQLVERIEKEKVQIRNTQEKLKSVSNEINNIRYQSTDATLYREIQILQSKQRDLEDSIMKLAEEDKNFEMHLKLSEAVFGFESFFLTMGSIIISTRCASQASKDIRKTINQKRFLNDNSFTCEIGDEKVPKSLNSKFAAGTLTLVSSFPTSQLGKGVKIFRATFLPDNNLMLACYQQKTVYVCNKNGEECKKVRIANFPGGITIYNRTYALVSAWQYGVQKIELENLKAAEVIKFRGECSAISSVQGQICVKNGVDHLKIVDICGKTIRKMPTMFNPWEVYLNETGSVYYSNLDNSDVHCVFPDGSNYITYSHPELLDPAGLTVDNQDNLYITGSRSDNIHRVSANREVKEVVLTKEDGIENPSGIAFNKQTNELLIVNEEFSSIRIYKVHMTMD